MSNTDLSDEALISKTKQTIQELNELAIEAQSRGLALAVEATTLDVDGVSRPSFTLRQVWKRMLRPLILMPR